ncbi:hypothetical protein H4R21_004043 [Coemansia helicoidea]|uniref:Uncharacterized protein n=1 Tax=Coemansia helicoidea TaxID=1286919 RepID=A0ACC1KZ26_9FUNG|nr:hypothetical protein H4R21_004043 [Coemansia helicoidea]
MDAYMTALLNLKGRVRGRFGPLVLRNKDASWAGSGSPVFDIRDEAAVRRAVDLVAAGDFAHLPPLQTLKALFACVEHQKLLWESYQELRLDRVVIDEATARVLAVILRSRLCRCRRLSLYRCSFTDAGRNILFSALSMMAEHAPPPHRSGPADLGDDGSGGDTAPMGLHSLELCQIGLADKGCAGLDVVLEAQPHLQTLSLRDNLIGPKGAGQLVGALRRGCPKLRALDLAGNRLRSQGVQHLAGYLASPGQALESLDISGNNVSLAGVQGLVRALCSGRCAALRRLDISTNQIGIGGCELLAHMLGRNASLEQLAVAHNNIFDDGCGRLFAGLAGNTTLRTLDVGGNFIAHAGARAIGRYLDAGPRGVPAEGAHAGLQRGLRSLNVSFNPLGDEGLRAVCRGLCANRHLTDLVANNIGATNGGARALRELLEAGSGRPTSLLTLSLRENTRLTLRGIEELASGAARSRHILRIAADLQFDGWRAAWSKAEAALVRNTVFAMERYRAPLLMVARGRVLLRDRWHPTCHTAPGIGRLPLDIRRCIVEALDTHRVLKPDQRHRATKIASDMGRRFASRHALLEEILGRDYPFVVEIMRVVNS